VDAGRGVTFLDSPADGSAKGRTRPKADPHASVSARIYTGLFWSSGATLGKISGFSISRRGSMIFRRNTGEWVALEIQFIVNDIAIFQVVRGRKRARKAISHCARMLTLLGRPGADSRSYRETR
jgi:hypothetical protein